MVDHTLAARPAIHLLRPGVHCTWQQPAQRHVRSCRETGTEYFSVSHSLPLKMIMELSNKQQPAGAFFSRALIGSNAIRTSASATPFSARLHMAKELATTSLTFTRQIAPSTITTQQSMPPAISKRCRRSPGILPTCITGTIACDPGSRIVRCFSTASRPLRRRNLHIKGQYVQLNLVYHTSFNLRDDKPGDTHYFYTGIEALYGRKENLDGSEGDANRLMWMVALQK